MASGSVHSRPDYVVGIGASAGGLEALERLFAAMPPKTGMAFVLVQHLSPDFKSLMNELLARRTQIPIKQVEDGMLVERDTVYLIPPKKEMIISEGRLLLTDKGPADELALPIDTFFRSLAQDLGDRAIAIVLSGSGSDGSRGIRDVYEARGFLIAQDEQTAKFDGMPKSARDTGMVDLVLPPEAMPAALLAHVQHPGSFSSAMREGEVMPRDIGGVFRLLERTYAIDFSHYKPPTVYRRIERRRQLTRKDDLRAYLDCLEDDAAELDALYRDLLIGVTRFFRDAEAFERVESVVLPEIIERLPGDGELRIWVAGCATGEEAYSLAISAQEVLQRLQRTIPVKIFATDVHRPSLEIASQGVYGEESVAEMPAERLQRWFARRGSSYQVVQDLRQMIVFAPHNVLKDAPFTRVDLVSCRNLLIYLSPHAQRKVLSLFHFGLKANRFLFLGPSENAGSLSGELEAADERWKLFRKRRESKLPHEARFALARAGTPAQAPAGRSTAAFSLSQLIATYDALLEEHMPPSILINERREVVHAFRGAAKYLRIGDGRPSMDLLELVDHDLRVALSGAITRAVRDRETVVYRGVRLQNDKGAEHVKLAVKPVVKPQLALSHLLISFEPMEEAPRSTPPPEAGREIDLDEVSREQIGALESELRYTKENLQATIEELETSNEELQATNEELLASNEELQSTNEELQSVNEELYTVNAEYQNKIAELTELTNDMENLLSSTEVGTIFLDRKLCIRKFTPRIAASFSLVPSDVGRSIASFSHTLQHEGLLEDVTRVLESGEAIEREVRDRQGRWHFLRILPYRAKAAVQGVVLTLIDIGSLKRAEDELFRERYLLNSVLDTVPDRIYFRDADGRFVRVNEAMARRLGLAGAGAAVRRRPTELLPESEVLVLDADHAQVTASGEPIVEQERRTEHRDGRVTWSSSSVYPLRDRAGEVVGTYTVDRDVTVRRRAEQEIRDAVRRRDQFLAMLSHELRNPLAAILNASFMLSRTPSPATLASARGVIERQSQQMGRLLDDLLEVSRVTQNKIDLKREVFDLRSVVDDAIAAVQPLIEERGLRLELALHPEPLWVHGDAARLQQIQVNLLTNAAKYNTPGERIELSLAREDSQAVLRVRDHGVGIPGDMLESIFELFVQCPQNLDRAAGGMGVGLTLVRAIVEMHGGKVQAFSEGPGKGSELLVRLPLSAVVPESVLAAAERAGERAALSGPVRRVVVIEDNADNREILQSLLEFYGFEVTTAADGVEGLKRIESERPQIAVIDIGLPGLDGYHLAQRIRKRYGSDEIFLIAVTGYGQEHDRSAGRDAGFDSYLVKPVNPDELMRVIESRPTAMA